MIFGSSNFFGVESESDFISPNHFGCMKDEDPCNPRIRMFIDDNISPRVSPDTRVIKHVIFEKCKKRKHRLEDDENCGNVSPDVSQFHVHEVQGSTEIAGPVPHNHRFAAVSGEARFIGNNHVHDVWFRTDYFNGHYHEAWGTTGFAIQIGDRHVHFLEGVTTVDAGHSHRYRLATLIENPIG